ncbi:MAG: hypothetical protein PHY73_04535 [Candidatus Omnitrophica bacterium]|nr:hypothetical protein [Candidatus Omnitrophota bacterium]
MKKSLFLKKINKRIGSLSGFTLLETGIFIVTASIFATVAIPAFTNAIENQRANTAKNTLKTVYMSQRRYSIDNNNNYASNLADLDIAVSALTGFKPLVVSSNTTRVATLQRDDNSYSLRITADGDLVCQGGGCQEISMSTTTNETEIQDTGTSTDVTATSEPTPEPEPKPEPVKKLPLK